MSLKIDSAIYGAKELEEALNQLPKSMGKSALRAVLKKAAKPVVSAAKLYAPVLSGDLRDSITVGSSLVRSRKRFQQKVGAAQVFVGPTWPKGAQAHLIEFGHRLVSHAGQFIRHIPAQPFLRPAWDENKERVLQIISVELWSILLKKARTLAGKAQKGTLSGRTIDELRRAA